MSQPRKLIPIAVAVGAGDDEASLLEIRRKIYPRAVTGVFANWSFTCIVATQLVFYGLPWLMWNGRQAVLFDLGERKFYLFGLVLWPQDVIYLAVLLIICAYGLFLVTAIAGRVWCGFACPQTVYTEIFQWIERKVEGDRSARIRLDGEPLSARKVRKKALKHGLWIALALWTGISFVGYFVPIRELVAALPAGVSATVGFWILFYAFATYGNAGWMREQVCKYMCPYARFQSVMFDQDTLVISYDPGRGEPRGSRSRKTDREAAGLGDCIDCQICVQVCPTGIDIRQGLQYECIGCAACIDGCNQVMDKMNYPRGLIRYTSEHALEQGWDNAAMWKRVLRPRTLLYTAVLFAIVAAAGITLAGRNALKVDLLRDRGALARESTPGVMENVYRIQIMNTDEVARQYMVSVEGLPGAALAGIKLPVAMEAAGARMLPLRVQVPADAAAPGTHTIVIRVQAVDDERVARAEKTTFILPRN